MDERELKERTRRFALQVVRVVDLLPKTASGRAVASQLVRRGTSVAANYRAAYRGRSKAEFVAKMGIVAEEAEECVFWLEPIGDGDLLQRNLVEPLRKEADDLTAIFVARTAAQSKIRNQESKIRTIACSSYVM
ncbi:MAG: four helix bundle protein [Chloroflexi bacterium]|nr:four helix bundle protein [Chloroflexota bacterium]